MQSNTCSVWPLGLLDLEKKDLKISVVISVCISVCLSDCACVFGGVCSIGNRPGVARAVLQTAVLLINFLTDSLIFFLPIFKTSEIPNH